MDITDKIIEYLSNNKDTLNLIIGSFATVIGAAIGFAINWFMLGKKLSHDANEKALERKLQILKEAYLISFNSISKMVNDIISMTPMKFKAGDGFEDKAVSDIDLNYEKIQLVGSLDTIKAFSKFIECYYQTRNDLEIEMIPAMKIQWLRSKNDIDKKTISNLSEFIHSEISKVLSVTPLNEELLKHLEKRNEENIKEGEKNQMNLLIYTKSLVLKVSNLKD